MDNLDFQKTLKHSVSLNYHLIPVKLLYNKLSFSKIFGLTKYKENQTKLEQNLYNSL